MKIAVLFVFLMSLDAFAQARHVVPSRTADQLAALEQDQDELLEKVKMLEARIRKPQKGDDVQTLKARLVGLQTQLAEKAQFKALLEAKFDCIQKGCNELQKIDGDIAKFKEATKRSKEEAPFAPRGVATKKDLNN